MYDFSKPYRTETIYNQVKNQELASPLCVPSYNRPDAPIFKSKIVKDMPKDKLFICIRDTKEQYDLYKKYENIVTLVPLPNYITDGGETREEILKWGIKHGFPALFMVDDRAQDLFAQSPRLSRNNKLMLGDGKFGVYNTLKIWEQYHLNVYPATLSYASYFNRNWYVNNINNTPGLGGFTEALCINLQNVQQYDIHFYSTRRYGLEDFRLVWSVMMKGLPVKQYTDISYKEVPPEKMPQHTGSGATFNFKSRKERMEHLLKVFVEKSIGAVWGDPIPGIKYVTLADGQIDLRFEWHRYWKKYYEQHKIK